MKKTQVERLKEDWVLLWNKAIFCKKKANPFNLFNLSTSGNILRDNVLTSFGLRTVFACLAFFNLFQPLSTSVQLLLCAECYL